jgi:hypothetical protein
MLWPLGAMLAMYFAMPMELFGGWGADHRLLPAVGLMLVGSLGLRTEGWRPAPFVAAALVAMVAVRVFTVTAEWRRADAEYAEFLRAFESVADGSRVLFAFGEGRDKQLGRRPYQHLPTLVLMKRQVFVPYLFAGNSGVGPLRYRPEVEPLRQLVRGKVTPETPGSTWAEVMAAFDYVLLVDARRFREPSLAQLAPVFEGQRVSVYRTPRAAPTAKAAAERAAVAQPAIR